VDTREVGRFSPKTDPRRGGTDLLRRFASIVAMGAGVPTAGALLPAIAHACAVCWGSSDDESLSRGVYWAMLFLMAMPFTIAGSVGGWLVYRYRHAARPEDPDDARGSSTGSTPAAAQEEDR
jgi:hypothetical protein